MNHTTTEPSFSPGSGKIPAEGRRILLLAFSSTCSAIMGLGTITPMVPKLAKVFAVSQPTASLVITMFTLPGILFAIAGGILADRYGRKAVLAPSLLLFSLGGTGCALAPNFETLLALRFIQGTGAASLIMLGTTMIADYWTDPRNGPQLARQLPRMIGYNMTVLSVCNAIYPSIGGLLAHFDWRFPFLLPALVLPFFFLALRAPLAKPGSRTTLRNYLGNLGHIFQDSRLLALFALTLLTFTMLYGPIITCFPVLGDREFHAGPATIGTAMLFSALGTALIASQLGRLTARFGSRKLMVFSQLLYVASLLLFPVISGFWWLILPIILFGFGQGLNVPNVQTGLLQRAPAGQRASIMAVNATIQRVGQTVSPLAFSFIMVWQGIYWGFYLGIGLAVLMMALALIFMPKGE